MDFMWRPYARSSLRLLGKDNVRKNIMFLRIATSSKLIANPILKKDKTEFSRKKMGNIFCCVSPESFFFFLL